MGFILLVIVLILFVSWQYQADQDRINDDYQRWKNRR